MLWQICLALVLVYTIAARKRNRKLKKIAQQLPNKMRQLPILGHAIHFGGNSLDRTKAMLRVGQEALEHGGVTSVWLAHKLVVVIADPESVEVVTKACLNKDDMLITTTKNIIGDGSIYAPVPIWRPRRKILTQNFSQRNLNNFMKIFSKQSEILMEKLSLIVEKGDISFLDYATKYSMDSICESTLGLEINSQSVPDHPMPKALYKACSLVTSRLVKPWLYPDALYKWHWNYSEYEKNSNFLKEFVAKLVKLKRRNLNLRKHNLIKEETSENNEQKTKSLLELLIESGGDKGFTNLAVQEESLVMLMAGTDTTATGLAFAGLMLARHPDIQEKLYQEIKQVLGDCPKDIDSYDLSELKYLDAFVKETLRLYPPGPMTVRKVEKDVTLPSGVTLIPGVCVVVHIWATHRNREYWGPDACVFRPERFLEGPLKHPCAFLAFSYGPRNCIGVQYALLSMKTALTHLITRYRLFPSPSDGNADGELPVVFEIMSKHADNFQLRLELRM